MNVFKRLFKQNINLGTKIITEGHQSYYGADLHINIMHKIVIC